MFALYLLLLSSGLWIRVSAQALDPGLSAIQKAYTPSVGSCPDGFQLVRSAGTTNQTLGADESAYVSARDSAVLPGAWSAYLQNVQSKTAATTTALPAYVSSILSGSSLPRLGIATSGGGYRAAIFGAGVLNALDERNGSSRDAGTGGLLQAATYLASLSGGSWLVSSAVQADFPTIQGVVFGPQNGSASPGPTDYGGWNAPTDILAPSDSVADNLQFYLGIIDEIAGKRAAGFPVTITDFWARLLARHFVNGTSADSFFDDTNTTHGAGVLFSAIANLSSFANHEIPFPIITANSDSSRQNASDTIAQDVIPLTNTIFEFTPFEMGSFDPTLAAFTPTKYLGTMNSSVCVTGFDQVAYIAGTSSELFNEFNTSVQALLESEAGPLFSLLNQSFTQPFSIELDVSLYPNAFFGVAPDTFIDSAQEYIGLVDGGEDGEVVPLQPLLVKARNVDVILAIDASADVDNFAAGASLVASQNRSSFFPSAYSFPQVPNNTETFVEQGLASRPTFFGCNESSPVPLVVYLANGAPPAGQPSITNTSTEQTSYETAELQAMLDEIFLIATQGFPANASQTVDPEWPACLACAVVDRKRAQESTQRSGICETCFSRYCWFP